MTGTIDIEEAELQGKPAAAQEAPRWSVPGLREALFAFLGLLGLAALTLGSWVLDGGFFLDDWADSAGTLYPPGGRTVGNVLSYFGSLFEYRPVLIVFTPLKYSILGDSITLNLAWTVLFGVLVATLVYTLLRTMRLAWYHAWVIAALTLVYPWYDSIRLWASGNPGLLGLFFAFAGMQVALAGVIRRDWRWHAAALPLYLLSVLSYEIAAPMIAVTGLLYLFVGGWREARFRWAADIAVVLVGLSWVGTHSDRAVGGLSHYISHLGEIVEAAPTIAGRTLYALGPSPRTALALLIAAAVLAVGVGVYLFARRERKAEAEGWGLREWLLLAAAGIAVAVLGWVMLIPADPYYTPTVYGVTNRVNTLAGYGLVIAAYAVIGTGVWLVSRRWPAVRRWAPLATVGLAVLLGATYVHVLERHVGIFQAASRAQRSALDQIKSQYPDLPPGTTLFTSDSPSYQALGVPIFAFPWDLNGAIKDEYEDGELTAYPVLPGMKLVCRPGGVGLTGEGAPDATAPYGTARFLNLATGQHATPRDKRRCEAIAGDYVPGPLYVSYAY